jgi:RHS repeat-associated protein
LYNGSTITGYLYNADGQRVAKGTLSSFSCSASFTPATQEIIGQNGEKLAETDSSGYWHTNIYGAGELFASYDPNGLHFLLNDWLGSRRVQTNSAGTTEQTCQNLPFGDELNCTSSDTAPNSFDFAGLEHDQESGLDHATARQYSSSMGQWTSPDSYDGSMNFGNPQSLNRYSYVGNAPLTFTDPSGMDGRGSGSTIESVLELAAVAIFDYATFDLFSHPSLTDSTKPRPDAQPWDEYHIHYGANIAGALGLPTTGGCEFGSCGSNLTAQQQAAITNAAQGWIGTPYVYGGCSRKGSDCSGSIIAIYAIAGITLPGRMTSGDFAHSSLFQRVTGNPEVGDVGVYPGHVDIFGGAAVGGFCPLHSNTDPCNVWSATHPGGNPFERANSGWFGTPVWYRYVGP